MARRDRRRRQAGAFAVSVLVHVALLVVLARVAVPTMYTPPSSPSPDVQLQLVSAPPLRAASAPRAVRSAETVRPLPAPAVRPPATERRPAPPARAVRAPPRSAAPTSPQAPAAPPSRASASVPAAGSANGTTGAAGGGSAGRWAVTGEDDGQDGVRRFLRATVGCSHEDYVKLTAGERADCDRRMGEEARTIGIPADKLTAFIVAAQAQERARAARTGPLAQPMGPCPGASNFSVSCVPPKPRE